MEATVFTGWIYDHLLTHAAALKVAHPLMLGLAPHRFHPFNGPGGSVLTLVGALIPHRRTPWRSAHFQIAIRRVKRCE